MTPWLWLALSVILVAGCDLIGRGDSSTNVLVWNDSPIVVTAVEGGADFAKCWDVPGDAFVSLIAKMGGPELFHFRFYSPEGQLLGESTPNRAQTLYVIDSDLAVQQKTFEWIVDQNGQRTDAVVVSDRPQLANRVPATPTSVECRR